MARILPLFVRTVWNCRHVMLKSAGTLLSTSYRRALSSLARPNFRLLVYGASDTAGFSESSTVDTPPSTPFYNNAVMHLFRSDHTGYKPIKSIIYKVIALRL